MIVRYTGTVPVYFPGLRLAVEPDQELVLADQVAALLLARRDFIVAPAPGDTPQEPVSRPRARKMEEPATEPVPEPQDAPEAVPGVQAP